MTNFTMSLSKYLRILFIRDAWSIGFRFNEAEPLPFNYETYFNIIPPSTRWWYADPFCVKHDDKYYIFCEMLDSFSGTGSIGVFEYSNGKVSTAKQVIKESFHMSYPNVFYYKDNFYMIPETRRSNQIRLYKAIEFPYKWEIDTVLADGIEAVDSTILSLGNKKYIFTYDVTENNNKLLIYQFDMDNRILVRTNDSMILDSLRNRRPAGNFISSDKNTFRPAQYNKDCYGEKLVFFEIESWPDSGYKEIEKCVISATQIASSNNRNYTRIHTINRDSGMEVVDLFDSKLCVIKPLLLVIKAIGRIYKRKIKQYLLNG